MKLIPPIQATSGDTTRNVTIVYHGEPEGWWAEIRDFPGLFVVGTSYEQTRDCVSKALPVHAPECFKSGYSLLHVRSAA